MKKSELQKRNTEYNFLTNFLLMKDIIPAIKQKLIKKLFTTQLGVLQKQFSLYFEDLNVSKFEWVRNPFLLTISQD
jgi:hypothetical protein